MIWAMVYMLAPADTISKWLNYLEEDQEFQKAVTGNSRPATETEKRDYASPV
jgi:hypothetical protein